MNNELYKIPTDLGNTAYGDWSKILVLKDFTSTEQSKKHIDSTLLGTSDGRCGITPKPDYRKRRGNQYMWNVGGHPSSWHWSIS